MPAVQSPDVEIRWTQDAAELAGALVVRERVFCDEQGVPRELEIDEFDAGAQHLVAVDGGEVVGTLRLLSGGGRAKVGRVAVLASHRRRGIARSMLEMAVQRARELGCREASLASQVYATALYEAVGFAVDSEEFDEVGIAHVWMRLALA